MTIKKRVLLLILPLAAAAYFLPQLYLSQIPTVTLVRPASQIVREQIPLTGTITAAATSELTCSLPLVASEVFVSVGDTVSVGDPIARIDSSQTLRAIAALLPTLSSLSELSSLIDTSDLSAASIPELLTAPAAGTVTSLSIKPKSMITPGVSCMTVSDCSSLTASLSVEEASANRLALSDLIYLKSDASDRIYTAAVTEIAPAAGQTLSGTSLKTVVEITAALTDTTDLKPGYSVTGVYFPDDGEEALFIPYSAVWQEKETEYVWVYENGTAVRRAILTQDTYATAVTVIDGLSEDDLVIDNPPALTDGKRVSIAKEAA